MQTATYTAATAAIDRPGEPLVFAQVELSRCVCISPANAIRGPGIRLTLCSSLAVVLVRRTPEPHSNPVWAASRPHFRHAQHMQTSACSLLRRSTGADVSGIMSSRGYSRVKTAFCGKAWTLECEPRRATGAPTSPSRGIDHTDVSCGMDSKADIAHPASPP